MIKLGQTNKLKILESLEDGFFLDDGEGHELWLDRSKGLPALKAGDFLEVFLFFDGPESLVVTTEKPWVEVGGFAKLEVVALERVGAFLDWGLAKNLFLPFSEQTRELRVGDEVLVFLYLDKAQRVTATMRFDKKVESKTEEEILKNPHLYKENQKVNLLILGANDLGVRAVIDHRFLGLIFKTDIFQTLRAGQELQGYIKKIREDGKIDLSLQPIGYSGSQDLGEKILSLLQSKNGFLPLTEKTPPEEIYEIFQVSKKKYKMALGGLYKKRLVVIKEDGIYLSKDLKS